MDIQGISGAGSVDPVDPSKKAEQGDNAKKPAEGSPKDEVTVSSTARFLSKLQNIEKQQPVRTDRVEELSNMIDQGEFETEERLDELGDRLVDELLSGPGES